MRASDYYKQDDAYDRKERERLRQQREANERALAAQAADRAWLRDYRARLARVMRDRRCNEDDARRYLLQDEELDRVVMLANERNAARRQAAAEEEGRRWSPPAYRADGDTTGFETKSAPLAISTGGASTSPLAADGRFTGLAATFDVKDSYGDIIQRGAFSRTLADAKKRGKPFYWPLLYQHDPTKLIGGVAQATETAEGLLVECQIDLNTRDGSEAYSLVKLGMLDGMSIGYIARGALNRRDARLLTQIDLLETSLVTFPANPASHVLNTSN